MSFRLLPVEEHLIDSAMDLNAMEGSSSSSANPSSHSANKTEGLQCIWWNLLVVLVKMFGWWIFLCYNLSFIYRLEDHRGPGKGCSSIQAEKTWWSRIRKATGFACWPQRQQLRSGNGFSCFLQNTQCGVGKSSAMQTWRFIFFLFAIQFMCSRLLFYTNMNLESLNLLWLLGDPAIGEGVNRFLFSRIMEKLKAGFKINLGTVFN